MSVPTPATGRGGEPDVAGLLDYLHRNVARDADVERKVRASAALRRWQGSTSIGDGADSDGGPDRRGRSGLDDLLAAARTYGWRDPSG